MGCTFSLKHKHQGISQITCSESVPCLLVFFKVGVFSDTACEVDTSYSMELLRMENCYPAFPDLTRDRSMGISPSQFQSCPPTCLPSEHLLVHTCLYDGTSDCMPRLDGTSDDPAVRGQQDCVLGHDPTWYSSWVFLNF